MKNKSKRPFKYSFLCGVCGDFKIGTKEKVAEYRKHHKIIVPIKDIHALAVTTGKKVKYETCPMMQIIDVKRRIITYARPELAKFLNKERNRKEKE